MTSATRKGRAFPFVQLRSWGFRSIKKVLVGHWLEKRKDQGSGRG